MAEDLQHAPLLNQRAAVPFTTLDEARESARQLAGPNAEIVHRYLSQQWRASLANDELPPLLKLVEQFALDQESVGWRKDAAMLRRVAELLQAARPDNWHSLASSLATELRYCMSVLADHHPDEQLSDFAWFRDGSEVLAEFDAAEAQP